jgi:adenylate kinase
MSKIIVLMGAPGAGKGTQARLLQERLHLPQISTGDIFRALKHAETPLAQEVRDIMERGQLVPDELTIRLVKERTAQDDCKNGYILDGFPRTPAQARSLEILAAEQGNDLVAVLIDPSAARFTTSTSSRRATIIAAICILKLSCCCARTITRKRCTPAWRLSTSKRGH